jgi:hypothetical protein
MAKKKPRKAGMAKRQQQKKHQRAQQRRKLAIARPRQKPQMAAQKELEDLLGTLPFLAFRPEFEGIGFDPNLIKQELEDKTPEPLILMRLLTTDFLAAFTARFEEFERSTVERSPDNLLAKATLHQLAHSAEIPHLSNPMIVALYLKARAVAMDVPAPTQETIHSELEAYEERNRELIEQISVDPSQLEYGPMALLPDHIDLGEDAPEDAAEPEREDAADIPAPLPAEVLENFYASLDVDEEAKERIIEDLETFLEDFGPSHYTNWTPALIDEFIDEWFVKEANPLEEDLQSMRGSILHLLRYLRDQSLLPDTFGETRPDSLRDAVA